MLRCSLVKGTSDASNVTSLRLATQGIERSLKIFWQRGRELQWLASDRMRERQMMSMKSLTLKHQIVIGRLRRLTKRLSP
jgi:hypothetical protein